jgi:hypothetical protein
LAEDNTPVGERSAMLDRRLGGFSIPMDWLEGMKNSHASQLFSHFRIIRAEIDYASNAVLYVAASELFDVVTENMMAPSYRVMIDPDGEKINVRVAKA